MQCAQGTRELSLNEEAVAGTLVKYPQLLVLQNFCLALTVYVIFKGKI